MATTRRSFFQSVTAALVAFTAAPASLLLPNTQQPISEILSVDEFKRMRITLMSQGWNRWVAPGPSSQKWFPLYDPNGRICRTVWTRFVKPGEYAKCFEVDPFCLGHHSFKNELEPL